MTRLGRRDLWGRRALLGRALRWSALAASAGVVGSACTPPRGSARASLADQSQPPIPTPEAVRPSPTEPTALVPKVAEPSPAAPSTAPSAVASSPRTPLSGELRLATNHAAVEAPWFRKVLDGFRERQPGVKVERVNVAARYLDQVPSWAAEGKLPDVLFVRCQHSAAWAYRKWLVGVDDLVERDRREVDPSDFYPPLVEGLKYQGKWLALPQDYSVHALYLGLDHFSEVGLSPPPADWSWADLLATARRLTKREEGRVARWGFNWWPDSRAMPGIWQAEGGRFLNDDQSGLVLNVPESVAATQWLADLGVVEGVAPTPGVDGGLFAAGKVAMEGNGSWAPAQYRAALGGSARVGLALLPLGRTGGRSVQSSGTGWAIGRDARSRDLAWALVKHLASKDSVEITVSLPVRNLPGRVSATSLWLDGLRSIGLPSQPEVFARAAVEAYPLKPVPWWLDYEDVYDELMPEVWAGRRKAADVLPELERRVNAAAARFR